MPDIAIRRLEGDEKLEAMHGLTSYALAPSPPLRNKDEWKEVVRPRQGVAYVALFEDGAPASGAAGTAMIQNVRGKLFDAHGVWGVATAPAARRNGYCRRVIAALLAAGRVDGQAFSTLYPFRESFYERLGYVTFPLPRIAKFAPSTLAPLLARDLGGRVELALIGDGFDAYRDYLARMRLRTHGMGMFVHGDRAAAARNRFWMAQAVVGDEPVGLMLYELQGEEETKYLFGALRFYYDSAQGRYLLLQWIARHVDQADRVELWLAPAEQPETWLADMQVKTESDIRAPMGRVLDVARLGGMSVGPGRFTARLFDPLCPWNEGGWRFESADGALQVAQGGQPDCDLTIQGLTALVYGTHDPDDFAIRGWGDPPPAVQAAMRAMFPRMHAASARAVLKQTQGIRPPVLSRELPSRPMPLGSSRIVYAKPGSVIPPAIRAHAGCRTRSGTPSPTKNQRQIDGMVRHCAAPEPGAELVGPTRDRAHDGLAHRTVQAVAAAADRTAPAADDPPFDGRDTIGRDDAGQEEQRCQGTCALICITPPYCSVINTGIKPVPWSSRPIALPTIVPG